jgi:type III pantothenate kinase
VILPAANSPALMRLLAIDIGNTRIKLGLFCGPELQRRLQQPTERELSSERFESALRRWLEEGGVSPPTIERAILASVVPALTAPVCSVLRALLTVEPLVVGPGFDTGLTLRGPDPRELGADRLVNAVAARRLLLTEAAPGDAPRGGLTVDLGTATKFDCVSPAGEFLGGVIAPGVQTSLTGLLAHAARLRSIELVAPPHVLGQSSVECLQSGAIYGHASLVDGLVARLCAELPFPCEVLATGGFCALIAPHTRSLRRLLPDLTLHGLYLLSERARELTSQTVAPQRGPNLP